MTINTLALASVKPSPIPAGIMLVDQNNMFAGDWLPIQVKQNRGGVERVGRTVIDQFEAVMAREDRQRGFVVALGFSSDAETEAEAFRVLLNYNMPAALAEKAEAVRMFSRIETLARRIRFPDRATQDFAETSATYGRIKYALFEQIWKLAFLGTAGAQRGRDDHGQLGAAISEYDRLWDEWRSLRDKHPGCPTLYRDIASPFSGAPGIGQTVENLRRLLPRP